MRQNMALNHLLLFVWYLRAASYPIGRVTHIHITGKCGMPTLPLPPPVEGIDSLQQRKKANHVWTETDVRSNVQATRKD